MGNPWKSVQSVAENAVYTANVIFARLQFQRRNIQPGCSLCLRVFERIAAQKDDGHPRTRVVDTIRRVRKFDFCQKSNFYVLLFSQLSTLFVGPALLGRVATFVCRKGHDGPAGR